MGVGLTLCYLYVLTMGCLLCCAGALGTSLTINEFLFKRRLSRDEGRQSVWAGLLFWLFLTQFCGELYLGYIFHFEERFECAFSAFIFANGGLGCLAATVLSLLALPGRRKKAGSDQH